MDFDSETFVTAFDPTQITSATNRSNPQPGDPCHTLAKGQHAPAIAFAHQAGGTQTTLGYDPGSCTAPTLAANQTSAICFSAKDHGADATEDCAPTLRAGGHSASHANAGVMPAIAFQERGREDGRSLEVGGELAYALTAPKDGGRAQERNVLTPTMQVRRLTPEECEALQGFPRSYTAIPHRGKPAADGPRYKALGNSWAVPCARWIGERIQAVEAIAAMKEAA